MQPFDPKAIREALLAKNVALNPPAKEETLNRLMVWAGGVIHPDVRRLMNEFDGFTDGDFEADSFVSVWSMDQAMQDNGSKQPILAFADWSLSSFVFGFNPLTGGSVINTFDGSIIAPSYAEFWSLLLADRLL
ncbi:hypothetical protein PQU92_11590 [Asticcacaulis sp. BYS171W]|uniref:Knr4/Smi1-like domain-containing protein n=1 Tax=Asticcacaulis aquaticus TaxID=2984212 RepID=A0ABT5HV16_9CAUL|nr:hypothetical protein [Asticcacaulis aquaticus]MDC7683921.1 hypothetical protein [Asticcacaulis aquaticus]